MSKLAPGFYEGMPYAEYDQIDAHNYSRLKYLERSPMAYRYNCDNPTPATAPMILGNASHLAILEPSLANFAVWPGPGNRDIRHQAYREWYEANNGKTLLNVKEMDYVTGMTEAVHANPDAHRYLRAGIGKNELTAVFRDLTFRRNFKIRIDRLIEIEGESVLVGLKSTVDCRSFRFGPQCHKMCYHVQDAIYQNGYFYLTGTLPRVVIIAVDSRPPHDSAVYRVPNDVLRQGQADLARWMERLVECEKTNEWPGAEQGEQDLVLPSYAYPGGDFQMDDLEITAR
jgi:hypothetical protein